MTCELPHESLRTYTTRANAYITGFTLGSLGGPNPDPGHYDAFLAKFDSAGNPLWLRQIGTTDNDERHDVAAGAAGNPPRSRNRG